MNNCTNFLSKTAQFYKQYTECSMVLNNLSNLCDIVSMLNLEHLDKNYYHNLFDNRIPRSIFQVGKLNNHAHQNVNKSHN